MVHVIPLLHNKLHDIYHSILPKDEESLHFEVPDVKDMNEIRFDETLFDFGIQYRIIATDCKMVTHIKIIGWNIVKDDALYSLEKHFGTHCVTSEIDLHNEKYPLDKVDRDFNVALVFKELSAQNLRISQLMNIRIQILGSRLSEVFRSINEEHPANTQETESFCIPIQRNIKISDKNHIFSIVVSHKIDRVTVVIPVPFQDETERALAKRFLQQLQQEQRNSTGKNAPICAYRRNSEPPLEFLNACRNENDGDDKDEEQRNTLAGYCSLTFLKMNVDTEGKRQKAVENVLMFYDFIDYNVKKMKSVVNAKLRQKYSELLLQMKEGQSNESFGMMKR